MQSLSNIKLRLGSACHGAYGWISHAIYIEKIIDGTVQL
jgi:hypothetical protein